MLAPANDTDWVLPKYKEWREFWPEYEARRGSKNGIGNGVLLMMDVETFEDAHYPRKADGLIVALSGNLERPLVGQSGTFLEPGSANLITFEVVGTNTTDEALIKYRPDINGNSEGGSRTCYVDNNDRLEFDPKYFDNANYFKFSMSNCLYSSMVTAIESRCNCTPTYSRREVKHTWSGPPPVSCVGDKMKCMENLTRAWGSNEHGLNMVEDHNVAHHCHLEDGQKTLYNPDSKKDTAARKAEDLLEKAVARYAEDNMLVV